MNNPNEKNGSPLAGIFLVLAFVAAAVALIIFLKSSTTRSLDGDGRLRTTADSLVATPALAPDEPASADAPFVVVSDTMMGTDGREVSDAGYEDGYWAGYDDAHLGQERASYDESCTFPTPAERRKYAQNYREGYAEGWQAGISDREAADRADEHKKMPQ